jgi:carbon monoxide dehydrogenase subunit G
VDGDDITGKIRVKVGPITQVYAGKAHFTERDRAAHVVTLEASGRETRGSGTASATVRSELAADGDQTTVTVLTNLNVTGKAAQFGRGVLAEVSGKLVGIFADNLAKMLAAEQAGASPSQAAAQAATADQVAAATEPGTAGPGTVPEAARGGQPGEDLSGDDLAQPIEELSLPLRAYNSLRREGVHTVADLVARTPAQLLAIDNIGPASVEDIRQRLADRGLSLAPTTEAEAAATAAEGAASANGSGGPAAAFPARPVRAPAPEAWQPDNDAVDLLSVAGLPVLKRVVPVAAGVVTLAAVVLAVRRLRRRRAG